MDSPGKRILKWREHLGLSPKQFADATDIPYSTLKTLENNDDPSKAKPSYDVIAKLRNAYPQLNIDWLFDESGTEPMLRDGRNLTPTNAHPTILPADKELVQASPALPTMSINREGELDGYWRLVAEERAERLHDKDREIDRLMEQLAAWQEAFRKPLASADAATHLTLHRDPIGFRPAARGDEQLVSMWRAA